MDRDRDETLGAARAKTTSRPCPELPPTRTPGASGVGDSRRARFGEGDRGGSEAEGDESRGLLGGVSIAAAGGARGLPEKRVARRVGSANDISQWNLNEASSTSGGGTLLLAGARTRERGREKLSELRVRE